MPQMNEDSDDYVFQQDDCQAHFHNDIRDYPNTNLHTTLDKTLWTRRCYVNALTTCISIYCDMGICKGHCFIPTVPVNLQELRDRITAALALIDCGILTHVLN